MHLYTRSLLTIEKSPHYTCDYASCVVKHTILYLQKIRREFIKIVDMRTNMIKCEYFFPNTLENTSVVEFI